jgi:hypothetical protein
MKASEVQLMMAIAARENLNVHKTDTKRAFLNKDIGEEIIFIRPTDWWSEPNPQGYAPQLMKSIYRFCYRTRQAAR